MNKSTTPFYYEDEIEEIILPDNSDKDKTENQTVTISSSTEDTEKTEENETKIVTEKEDKGNPVFEGISNFGEYMCKVLSACLKLPLMLLTMLAKFIWTHTKVFRETMVRIGKAIISAVTSPFVKTWRAFKRTKRKIDQAKENGDKRTAIKLYLLIVKDSLFGKRGLIVTLFNYAVPLIALVFVVSVVGYATSTTYAIKLSVNGKFVGYIENEQVFIDAEQMLQDRITYMGVEKTVVMEPQYSLEMLGDQSYVTKYQLVNKMLELSDQPIEYAYGMYIGNKFYGALVEKAPVEAKTNELLENYRTNSSPDEEVAFEKKISYVPGLYLSDSIVDAQDIIKLITSKKVEAAYYTVVDGDSHYLICEKLGITMEELEALNPGIMDEDFVLRSGQKILKNQEVPFLSVSISRTEVYEVEVPYDTEYTTDDQHYQGVNTPLIAGEYGINEVTAKVYYVNGEEVKRDIISTVRTKDPVTELISQGTLPPQSSHYSDEEVNINTKYIWPVDGGELSEWGWWDGGYGGHQGVDIVGYYGSDIYAGASGVVSYAGWHNGGFGYLVVIDHPDGYSTYYAHNSEIFVYEGQSVVQGQCIAALGESGRAYGAHCHFEVRDSYGNRLNPRYYLNSLPELYDQGYLRYWW
ncbi:MAG: peptidoglycan DD-metalloendopeptidase family protein [Ruminiclostridium sp.]|nr:peptidoglycan DD-metalloendopeptidase family protein [Ruminiclostridium sp.]